MTDQVVVTGTAVLSGYGRGTEALLAGMLSGKPAFAPVRRFGTETRRVRVAAEMPGSPDLVTELARATREACDQAGLGSAIRARTPLYLAIHGDPAIGRAAPDARGGLGPDAVAATVTSRAGLAPGGFRCYLSACVAASTAIADAASLISRGQADRVVITGGYLVEQDQFALFDAGRALAADGQVRPFSTGRRGLLLGDGVGAVLIEARAAARARGAAPLARLTGWGRAGDGYHPCQPHPDGDGMARAVSSALRRAGLPAGGLGYINAHGSGTGLSDTAEASALRRALGDAAGTVPVSGTKSLHGQSLEASGVLELIVTLLALRAGMLPVNAGFLGEDSGCRLNLVLGEARPAAGEFAMSLNAAFGGANTALVAGLP